MGASAHGGFGNTAGGTRIKRLLAMSLSPVLVGKGEGEMLKVAASWIKPNPKFVDVVIHGTDTNTQIMHNGSWVKLDQRRLALIIKKSKDYKKGAPIRLMSCSTGAKQDGFAQNLANKLGVPVYAPSGKLWIKSNGTMSIGATAETNTGYWKIYRPNRKKGKKK